MATLSRLSSLLVNRNASRTFNVPSTFIRNSSQTFQLRKSGFNKTYQEVHGIQLCSLKRCFSTYTTSFPNEEYDFLHIKEEYDFLHIKEREYNLPTWQKKIVSMFDNDLPGATLLISNSKTEVSPLVMGKLLVHVGEKKPEKFLQFALFAINHYKDREVTLRNPYLLNVILIHFVKTADLPNFVRFVKIMKSLKISPNNFSFRMYLQILKKFGKTDLMFGVLEEMKHCGLVPDSGCYTDLIHALDEGKEWASLQHLISKMFAENVVISESLYCYLITFYGNQGNVTKVEQIFKKGFEYYNKESLRIVTSLMASYGKLGMTKKLRETYETYKFLNYDEVAYTAMLNSIMSTPETKLVDIVLKDVRKNNIQLKNRVQTDLCKYLTFKNRPDLLVVLLDEYSKKSQPTNLIELESVLCGMLFIGRKQQAAEVLIEYSKAGFLPKSHLSTFLSICKNLGIDNPNVANEVSGILDNEVYGYQDLVSVLSKFK